MCLRTAAVEVYVTNEIVNKCTNINWATNTIGFCSPFFHRLLLTFLLSLVFRFFLFVVYFYFNTTLIAVIVGNDTYDIPICIYLFYKTICEQFTRAWQIFLFLVQTSR